MLAAMLVVVALVVGIEIGHSSSGSGAAATVTTRATTATSKTSGSGGSALDKAAKSTGKAYVQQENKLPTSVTP